MRYLTLLGLVTIVFFVVYGFFAWVDRNAKREIERRVKPKSVGYQPTWTYTSYEVKPKPEVEEFETVEKVNKDE